MYRIIGCTSARYLCIIHQRKKGIATFACVGFQMQSDSFPQHKQKPHTPKRGGFVGKKPKESVDNVNAAVLVNSDGNEIAPEVVRILFYQLRR